MSKRLSLFSEIAELCATWYRSRGRHYSWSDSRDPYRILVAEFLLRKTQVYRMLPIYDALMSRYPTILELAKADPMEVRNMVAPLGLPERGPQMVTIARSVVRSGDTIESGKSLLKFKGVGRYIASAIECLSFGRVAPLVDGAVGRLLRRVFGLTENKPAYADEALWKLAQKILEACPKDCREVALGMIDLSSEFCKPHNPLCDNCPLMALCRSKKRVCLPSKEYKP